MLNESRRECTRWRDPINITKEQWVSILRDEKLTTEKDMQLLQLMYDSEDCRASGSQLAPLLDMSHQVTLSNQVSRWAKKIVKKLNISAPKYRDTRKGEGDNWWHVPFWGDEYKTESKFYWILRPELEEAMYELAERN